MVAVYRCASSMISFSLFHNLSGYFPRLSLLPYLCLTGPATLASRSASAKNDAARKNQILEQNLCEGMGICGWVFLFSLPVPMVWIGALLRREQEGRPSTRGGGPP